MKRYMVRSVVAASMLFVAATMSFEANAQQPAKKPAGTRATLRAASEMKWEDVPDAKGAQMAVVWGNAQKGAHGAFARFAAGTETPPAHAHGRQ